MILIIKPTKVSRDQSCQTTPLKTIIDENSDWLNDPHDKSYQSLYGLKIVGQLLERQKFNQVSDSGFLEPLVCLFW